MKCIVVGGGGFIGSHLSEALLTSQHDVTVFDRVGASYLEMLSRKGATIVKGSFLVQKDLYDTLAGADVVFHLASTTVPKSSIDDPAYDVQTNLVGAINLLTLAKDLGVKKMVFASSGGTVYGIPQAIPITEDHPTNPISSYGIIKLTIEKYLALYYTLYNLDYCILRVSNAYGERQPATGSQGIIPTLISRALQSQEIRIWGDGSVIRDYIHVSDIISAFLSAMSYNGEPMIFNIGSGNGHSVNEIVKTLEGEMEEPLKLVYEPARPYDVPINVLDNSRAMQVLGWEPKVSLRYGIRQTLEYMRSVK